MNQISGGNLGLSANMGYHLGYGNSFGFGITTGLGSVIFPEVKYQLSSKVYGVDSLGQNLENKQQDLGLGLNTKIPIYRLKLGKSSKGECWWLKFTLLGDFHYNLNLSNKSNFAANKNNGSVLNFGLGISPRYSGGHKSRVAWSYFYDVYYQLDLTGENHFNLQNTGIKFNGVFIRFTFLHHKTSDFLGGTSKKKSYKKKY